MTQIARFDQYVNTTDVSDSRSKAMVCTKKSRSDKDIADHLSPAAVWADSVRRSLRGNVTNLQLHGGPGRLIIGTADLASTL